MLRVGPAASARPFAFRPADEPVPAAKSVSSLNSGAANARVAFGVSPGKGAPEKILLDKQSQEHVSAQALPAPGEPQARVGLTLGLKLNGPKGSYSSATVDVYVELPCGVSPEATSAALTECSERAAKHLADNLKELQDFLQSEYGSH